MSVSGTYRNPILPGFNPDPSIVRIGPDFFCVTSSFEYFPGCPIYHSRDLVVWTLIGHALTRRSQVDIKTPEPGGGVWAATLRWHDGVFYVVTSCFDRYRPQDDDRVWPRGFYVTTTDIWKGQWSEPVWLDQVGFDHDLFWDDDGTVYLSSTYRKMEREATSKLKDFAVHISTVDLQTGRLTCAPRLVRESSSGVAEGSHLFKRNGWYYLFTAEGGTESGHCEYVSRSRDGPFGPWEMAPHNPLWKNTVSDEVQNTGHCDLVEDQEGQWWALCLGVRPCKTGGSWRRSVFGRESFLIPVRWDGDWPTFNEGRSLALEMTGPGKYVAEDVQKWRDEFVGSHLGLGWYRKNTPYIEDVSLVEKPGHLTLHGSPYNLSSPAAPTMVLRKQRHWPVTWETQLDFQPRSTRVEAGTTAYWNYTCFASIGIRATHQQQKLTRIVRFTPPTGQGDAVEMSISNRAIVRLIIDCQADAYRFGFRDVDTHGDTESTTWLGRVETQVLTRDPAIGAPFTGMTLGLYAFGDLEPVLSPAHFAFAEFR
ncbi:hypothetical protein CAC42_6601 [Sphaceloma murrayae]|uniref:Beta-xylosidase C-terminal Concanavalin A-like domain-containing protein n=1 Tax=Sphaceloma murrayae TaxID=2082308 RepID=A0A2K1QFX8_9PEZI|nr:hypothetical protein CAC42_6601 [Sphaceloma murrayae]